MSTLTIHIPESIRRQVDELAAQDGVSAEQFLATAAAEKVSALRTLDYLRAEAAGGSKADWDRVLDQVPARPPITGDEGPPDRTAAREQPRRKKL
jgi:hypothetical protein